MDLRQQMQQAVRLSRLGPPCSVLQIEGAEHELGQELPSVLKALYLAFDGATGPAANFLWPLLGHNGLVGNNLFYRGEDYAPSWVKSTVFFGDNGLGGSVGASWGIDPLQPSQILEWGVGDEGEEPYVVGTDVFEVWIGCQRHHDQSIRE